MDRQIDRQTERQTGRRRDRQIDNQIDGQIDRQIDRYIDRHIDKQIGRQIYRHIDRQTDRQIKMYSYALKLFKYKHFLKKTFLIISPEKYKERAMRDTPYFPPPIPFPHCPPSPSLLPPLHPVLQPIE